MLSDDIVALVIASIPEPIGDDAAVWVSDLCFAIEAEVREQDEALIRQMLEALERVTQACDVGAYENAIFSACEAATAARLRLEGKP